MKISIVIPSYNQQEFLPDAVESVLEQTRHTNELIIVDDGSTDNSLKLAQAYLNTDIKLTGQFKIISQVNKGLASARNTGIMNATGDYILFLDADDILLENCLEKMADGIDKTGADIIAPSFKNFGIVNDEIKLHPNPTMEMFRDIGNMIPYFSAIKREALLECGGYSPRMALGYEDYALWFDLFLRGKTLVVLQDTLALYRTKKDSMLTNAVKHHDELMAQIKKDFPSVWQK